MSLNDKDFEPVPEPCQNVSLPQYYFFNNWKCQDSWFNAFLDNMPCTFPHFTADQKDERSFPLPQFI